MRVLIDRVTRVTTGKPKISTGRTITPVRTASINGSAYVSHFIPCCSAPAERPSNGFRRIPMKDPWECRPAGDDKARVIATGTSRTTGRDFNLIVALEGDDRNGRGIAESSFHHLCDYNWDPRAGSPSFVTDPPSDDVIRDSQRLEDVKTYVRNAARWLGGEN